MTRITFEIEDELSKGKNISDTGNFLELAQKILGLCFMTDATISEFISHSYQGYELTLSDIVICNIRLLDIYGLRDNYMRSVVVTIFIRKDGKRIHQVDTILTPCIVQIRLKSSFNRDADVYEFRCIASSSSTRQTVTLIQSPK